MVILQNIMNNKPIVITKQYMNIVRILNIMNTIGFPVLFCGQKAVQSEHKRSIVRYWPRPLHDVECATLRISQRCRATSTKTRTRRWSWSSAAGCCIMHDCSGAGVGFRVKLSQTFQEQPVTRPLQVTVTDGYKLVDTAEFWRPRGRECHSNVLAVTYHYNPLHIMKTHTRFGSTYEHFYSLGVKDH